MAQRGRPPHPGPLTPAEARVLEHVRAGLPNAEIAVRLGISVNTVRYHVSNLLAKAGASSREELARWRPRGERKGWRWGWLPFGLKPVLLGLAALGVVGIGAFLWVPVPDPDEEPASTLPEPFTVPDPDELRAEGYVDTGPFLRSDDDEVPVVGYSPRSLFTSVLPKTVDLSVGEPDRIIPRPFLPENYGFSLTLRLGDARYVVALRFVRTRGSDAHPPSSAGEGAEIVLHPQPGDLLLIAAYAYGTSAADHGADTYRTALTTDGHLWLDPEPISTASAYDEWTGQQLDLDDAVPAGWLDPAPASILFTGCNDGYCYISYRTAATMKAPVDGELACESSTTLRLETDTLTLRIDWADTGYGGPPEFDCTRRHVTAGEEIGPIRHYSITAYDAHADKVSAAITPDGHLYVGHFAPTIGCPCRQGT